MIKVKYIFILILFLQVIASKNITENQSYPVGVPCVKNLISIGGTQQLCLYETRGYLKILNTTNNYELLTDTKDTDTIDQPPLNSEISNILQYSSDQKHIFSGTYSGKIHVRDPNNYQIEKQLSLYDGLKITSLAQSPDTTILASGNYDGTIGIFLYTVDNYAEKMTLTFSDQQILDLIFTKDGKKLISSSQGNGIQIYSVDDDFLKEKQIDPVYDTHVLLLTPDQELLISSGDGPEFYLWDVQKDFSLRKKIQKGPSVVQSLVFSPDGSVLASHSPINGLKIWDVKRNYELFGELEFAQPIPFDLKFKSNKKLIASEKVQSLPGNPTFIRELDIEFSEDYHKPKQSDSITSKRSGNNRCLYVISADLTTKPGDANGNDQIELHLQNEIKDQVSVGLMKFSENKQEHKLKMQIPCIQGEEVDSSMKEWDPCGNDYKKVFLKCETTQSTVRQEIVITPESTVLSEQECKGIASGNSICAVGGFIADICSTFEWTQEYCESIETAENEATYSIQYEVKEEEDCNILFDDLETGVYGSFESQPDGEICEIKMDSIEEEATIGKIISYAVGGVILVAVFFGIYKCCKSDSSSK